MPQALAILRRRAVVLGRFRLRPFCLSGLTLRRRLSAWASFVSGAFVATDVVRPRLERAYRRPLPTRGIAPCFAVPRLTSAGPQPGCGGLLRLRFRELRFWVLALCLGGLAAIFGPLRCALFYSLISGRSFGGS